MDRINDQPTGFNNNRVTSIRQATHGGWIAFLLLTSVYVGCASNIHWANDPPATPSCLPDRPPIWDDFSKRSHSGKEGALTVVRFHIIPGQPARLQVQFDHEQSWVKPEFVDSWDPWFWSQSGQVLRHEQLHFAISCLLTRQSNVALRTGGDPQAMLLLLQAVSTRMNVQYDAETNHGLDHASQAIWEHAVQSRLKAGVLE